MGLLHYSNLEDHRSDILLERTFYGLRPFNDFLMGQKRFLESDKAVKFIGWEKIKSDDKGIWIQLAEVPSLKLNLDSLLKIFLDESVLEVYEIDIPEDKQRINFNNQNKITVLEHDSDTEAICVERLPKKELIAIRPNTYQINCQLKALGKLRDEPAPAHRPLLKLFESTGHASWLHQNEFNQELVKGQWKILTDETRPGTKEQRAFVVKALSTPDFALLEGPPGSGKTTVICELIRLLCEQGKRVLLCASTHVAVDNVLERIMDDGNEGRDEIIPIRIGDAGNVSEKIKDYQFGNFIKTERRRILSEIQKSKSPTPSQLMLKNELNNGSSEILERLVLDSANLICGTTIGILQHPDIKGENYGTPQFDFMIIDEASKTTFQEFLVPALLAKRWVLVGDPMQLSPYVDDDALSANIEVALPEEYQRNACLDVFLAGQNDIRRAVYTIASTDNAPEKQFYQEQTKAHNVACFDADTNAKEELPYGDIIVGSVKSINANKNCLPLDVANVRGIGIDDQIIREVASWADKCSVESTTWENEIAWRISRLYEQRFSKSFLSDNSESRTVKRLTDDIEKLMPVLSKEKVHSSIESIRKVALPSVLESLKKGFERDKRQRNGTALTDGLPESVCRDRSEKLMYQHRMHPDISAFSHVHFYEEEALHSPEDMVAKRTWQYGGFPGKNAIWLDLKGRAAGNNSNRTEAEEIVTELRKFDEWAQKNAKEDGGAWEVALLTFYRGQEREIRNQIRRWTGNLNGFRYFKRGEKNTPYLEIQICTVDRFQGHEADMVLLSFVKNHPTSFLESPNRLNVALTRARYQVVVVGDRKAMQRSDSFVGKLASKLIWEQRISSSSPKKKQPQQRGRR